MMLPQHSIRKKDLNGHHFQNRVVIETLHNKVETHQEFGHFEADTVLSGKRKGQAD